MLQCYRTVFHARSGDVAGSECHQGTPEGVAIADSPMRFSASTKSSCEIAATGFFDSAESSCANESAG
jgi:hypothetical protein